MNKEEGSRYFVGSLPGSVRRDDVWHHFSKYGTVLEVDIIKNPVTQYCKGFGFVRIYLNISEEEFLYGAHEFQGSRRLTVQRHLAGDELYKKRQEFDSTRLFLTGLTSWITESDLKAYFSRYGKVALAFTANNKSKEREQNLGCVHFENADIIDQVVTESPHMICGTKIKCARYFGKNVKSTEEMGWSTPKNSKLMETNPLKGTNSRVDYKKNPSLFKSPGIEQPSNTGGPALHQQEVENSCTLAKRLAPALKNSHRDMNNVRFNIVNKSRTGTD